MVYDTRIDVVKVDNKVLTFFEKHRGNAVSSMKKWVEKDAPGMLLASEGFFVLDSEGPLDEGEEARAAEWAKIALQ